MKRKHVMIRNGAIALTLMTIAGFFFYGQKVKSITADIERQIKVEQAAIEEKNTTLVELQQQVEEMDSPEYIKKIASEELGMVEEDTIVFKLKE